MNCSFSLQIKCIQMRVQFHPFLTCDFKCVWFAGLYVYLPGSHLLVSIETNSPQVAHCLYGPQFAAGLDTVLAHSWNLVACTITLKYASR